MPKVILPTEKTHVTVSGAVTGNTLLEYCFQYKANIRDVETQLYRPSPCSYWQHWTLHLQDGRWVHSSTELTVLLTPLAPDVNLLAYKKNIKQPVARADSSS